MLGLLKMLWRIPRFLLTLIWEFIWSLIKLGFLITLVVIVLITYARTSSSSTASSLAAMFNQVEVFFNSRAGDDMTKTVEELLTDSYQPHAEARWSTRQATVYIATEDETFRSAYRDAIANWNATGAFTFVLVDDATGADIVADDRADANTQAAGVANTLTDTLTNNLRHADVLLNSYYLKNESFGYEYDRIVHTAEHELGHAIGLPHDDSQESVMQSAGSYYGIQQSDIEAVNHLYANIGG